MKTKTSYIPHLKRALTWPLDKLSRYWKGGRWHKFLVIMFSIGLLSLGTMYGIARWYIWSERNVPLTMGVSFIPDYASYLGVNPQQTMDGLINDVHVKQFRLTSYWTDIEPTPGHYDFTQLDWEFQKAEAAHAKITLSLGLRQPRYPECHMPDWASKEPVSQWEPQLESVITAVMNRYKNSPSLQSYQLENEYLLHGFGTCTNFDRQRLVDEFNLVKKTDPNHPVIISRSNNDLGVPLGQPTPDEYGVSIYKRTWDSTLHTHRYLEYPFPAWYYAFLAGVQKIITGKDMIVHELQAEAWAPNGKNIPDISLAEQNKSLDAKRLQDRFNYGKGTAMTHLSGMWPNKSSQKTDTKVITN